MIFYLLAEGQTEEYVASKLVPFCGHELSTVYGRKGVEYIKRKASLFRVLATDNTGLLVLTDFRDADAACVPDALHEYLLKKLPIPPKTYLLRFAVNEIESWLMADREGISEFLSVSKTKIPLNPENEQYPKRTLINIARLSRSKVVRNEFVPQPGHLSNVGPDYMNMLNDFITNYWDIDNAMNHADSLKRCVHRLRSV